MTEQALPLAAPGSGGTAGPARVLTMMLSRIHTGHVSTGPRCDPGWLATTLLHRLRGDRAQAAEHTRAFWASVPWWMRSYRSIVCVQSYNALLEREHDLFIVKARGIIMKHSLTW
jgi:hypothetical protein